VTVIVDGVPPVQQATGIALHPSAAAVWLTEDIITDGRLMRADLATGAWSILAHDVISGATSIVVNQAGTRAYFTQLGLETSCTGKLSRVDVDPLSPTYLGVTDVLTGLCGPHDLDVRADERQFYVVLVGSRQLIRVDLMVMVYLPLVVRAR